MPDGIFSKIKGFFSREPQPEGDDSFNPFAEADAKRAPLATIMNLEGLYEEMVQDDDFVLDISSRPDTYRRMRRDAHVAAAWDSRTNPVASAPWRIVSTSSVQGEELTKQINTFPDWQRYNLALLDAIFRGWAGIELIFNEPGSRTLIRDFIAIEQEFVSFTNMGRPRLITMEKPYHGVPMPFPQFIVVSWGDQRNGRRRGRAVGQRVYWPWFFRTTGYKFWAKAIERFGMPGLKAKIRATGNKAARRDRFMEIMRDYVGGTGVVFEEGEELDLLNPKSPGNAYKIFNEFYGAEISKTILGQTLTMEAGSRGAFTLGKVHADVADAIMWSDSKWLGEQHSRFTLQAIGSLLYGEKYEPAKFEYLWEDPEEGLRNAKMITELAKIKIPLREEDVYTAINFPKPESSDETFEFPEALPGQTMPTAGGEGSMSGTQAGKELSPENLAVQAKEALNGAQITAALSIVEKVVTGEIGEQTAIELMVATGISREAASKMVKESQGIDKETVEPKPGGGASPFPEPAEEFSEASRFAESQRIGKEQDVLSLAGMVKAIDSFNLDRMTSELKKNGASKGSRLGPFSKLKTSKGSNGS